MSPARGRNVHGAVPDAEDACVVVRNANQFDSDDDTADSCFRCVFMVLLVFDISFVS